MQENIKSELLKLIALETEGGYWDFKEKWNDDKTSLLHDIICMANNLENRDAYIIFGVRDSKAEDGFGVVGVELSSEHRKDQEKLITFLRDKKFAGGVRPRVYLYSFEYDIEIVLDIVVIKNTMKTPYYLTEKFEGVNAHQIYTRIEDTNTPKDKSADIDKIEYLWKKRFGLELSILNKLKFLLRNPHEWLPMGTDGVHSSEEFNNNWYHAQFPEFTICYELDDRSFINGKIERIDSSFYWLNKLQHPLHNVYMYRLNIRYHSTVIHSSILIFADNYRFKRTLWKSAYIRKNQHESFTYHYIEKDHIDYLIDRWLNNSYEIIEDTVKSEIIEPLEPWKRELEYKGAHNPYSVVPVFNNKIEHSRFLEFFNTRIGEFESILGVAPAKVCTNPEYIEYLCRTGEIMVNWLNEWRKI